MTANKTLLLIEPPFYRLFKPTFSLTRLPLSLGYIGSVVHENTSWRVRVYNADFCSVNESTTHSYLYGKGYQNYLMALSDKKASIWKEIHSAVSQIRPSVVGISVKTQTLIPAVQVAKIVKSLDPRIPVIIGGPHPTLDRTCLEYIPEFDIGVYGEGERTVIDLLDALAKTRDLLQVKGILLKRNKGLYMTAPRTFIKNLDWLPFPSRYAEDILIDYSLYPRTAFKYIFTTRGCPYSCMYCGTHGVWGNEIRFRSMENISEEIKYLHQMKGIRYIHFDDDTFGVTDSYLKALCKHLMQYTPFLKWSCETHPDLINTETAWLMKKAGCLRVSIGMESAENETLSLIGKQTTVSAVKKAVHIIRRYKMAAHVFLMIGFPWDTLESLKKILYTVEHLEANRFTCSIVTPYPGTELYNYCVHHNLLKRPVNWERYHHQSPDNMFLENIEPPAFWRVATKIMQQVDIQNARNRLKRIFSREMRILTRDYRKEHWLKRAKGLVQQAIQLREDSKKTSWMDKSE